MTRFEKKQKKHFNKTAKNYDNHHKEKNSKISYIGSDFAYDYLKDKNYKNLLDIGCGTGYLIDRLSSINNSKHTGIDISNNMIEICRSKDIKNSSFLEMKSTDLKFSDNSFDYITCIHSFHHYDNQLKALEESYRVLKRNGIYLIVELEREIFNHPHKKRSFISRLFKKVKINHHTLDSLTSLIEKTQYEIVDKIDVSDHIFAVVCRKN